MIEFFKLLFIGIFNLFYNLVLGIWECCCLARFGWWWRLRAVFLLYYITDSPFGVIKREGQRAPVAQQNLIYGETPCLTIRDILAELCPQDGDHFVDLGCGRGLVAFFVRFYYRIPVTGVDVIPTFINRAGRIAHRLSLSGIDFMRENLSWVTLEQIGRGTIFYLAGTTFEEELLEKIALRLELLPPGVRLITLSEALPSERFRVVAIKPYFFSWGKTTVYFHEKVV
ncbi:MAG: hypothetical protein AB1489_22290 [Acidobacteriota bacterium]